MELRCTNGVIRLSAGNRLANWEGLSCWLGFAPQWIQNELYVNVLDAEKSLLPLMQPLSLSRKSKLVLVLDPGHGGRNPGATSVFNGRYEKEYTLDWAKRIQSLLATNGWQVYLTRTNDQDLSLADRTELARNWHADFFVSLHFNSALPHTDQSGLESYCLTPQGMPSSLTRDYADDATEVFPNNEFDAQNFQFAADLQRALVLASGSMDRGVRRARFMGVLREQRCPAVLLEGGYLSNPEEARLISQPAYRQKLAEAVARGVMGFED